MHAYKNIKNSSVRSKRSTFVTVAKETKTQIRTYFAFSMEKNYYPYLTKLLSNDTYKFLVPTKIHGLLLTLLNINYRE